MPAIRAFRSRLTRLRSIAASQTGLLNTPAGQASFFPAIAFSGGVDNPSNEAGYDENQKVSNAYSAV